MTKSKWMAAGLNLLLPGIGFFYARKRKTAIVLFVLGAMSIFSLRVLANSFPVFVLSFVTLMAVLLYGFIGGLLAVDQKNEYPTDPLDKPYVYGATIILYNGLLILFIFQWAPIAFAHIPTPSMNPTLQIGDYIAYRETKSIDRSDIVTFWWPDDTKTMYIMRCVALPGDSVAIKSGQVSVNNTPREEGSLKMEYMVITKAGEINQRVLKKIGLGEDDFRMYGSDRYGFHLTEEEAAALKTIPWVKEVTMNIIDERQPINFPLYAAPAMMNWSVDFFGPLYLPKKGDKIELTAKNIALYSKCIALENEHVEDSDSTITINGKQEKTYEFKDDYYFMMGDNRHNTLDSRYWGLLPGRLVIGKAKYVYWGKSMARIGSEL
jgi:signal peptidase I